MHNVKKCFMDYVISRPIYAYSYTINVMYYDTMVLFMKNYFSHQVSELGTSGCKCQADMSSWPYVVLLLAFHMCNFVSATTKLQSNNKNYNNNNNKNNQLFIIEQKMHVDLSFCSWSCCVSYIILLLLQQHNYTVTTTTTQTSIYINSLILNSSYLDWCFYCHFCCCYCVIILLCLLFIGYCASTITYAQIQNYLIRTTTTTTTPTNRSIYINCQPFH